MSTLDLRHSSAFPGAICRSDDRALVAIAIFALCLTTLIRIFVGSDQPLWLDEAGTGAIVAHPVVTDFLRAVYEDVNAPLYYLILYPWQAVAGTSNAALRFPGVIFGILAPAALLWKQVPGLSRADQLTWSALVALWIPGLWDSQDARCYTLILLICAAQSIAYARLLSRPDTRLASSWAGLSALAILTQYHVLLLAGLQGLAYLAIHRKRALHTWPAALIFLLPALWLCIHLPHVAAFMRHDIAWYWLLDVSQLPQVGGYILGDQRLLVMVPLLCLIAWALNLKVASGEAPLPRPGYVVIVAITSIAALAITIILGFVRPSFTLRYVTPFMPGALLGLVLLLRPAARRVRAIYPAIILVFMLVAGDWAHQELVPGAWARGETREPERIYNYEIASEFLIRSKPKRLVFFWDNPASRVLTPAQLQAMGGFFFQRNGDPIPVEPIVISPEEDPNLRLQSEAKTPGTVILWLYHLQVRGTAATAHLPRLTSLDSNLRCRDFGRDPVGVVACYEQREETVFLQPGSSANQPAH